MFLLWWLILHSRWHVHKCSGVDWEHEHRAGWQQEAVSYEWWNHSNDHSDEPHLWGSQTSTPTPGQPEEELSTLYMKMLFFTSTCPSSQSLCVFSVWAARTTSFSRLVSRHIEILGKLWDWIFLELVFKNHFKLPNIFDQWSRFPPVHICSWRRYSCCSFLVRSRSLREIRSLNSKLIWTRKILFLV